jgi:hypothetical protein
MTTIMIFQDEIQTLKQTLQTNWTSKLQDAHDHLKPLHTLTHPNLPPGTHEIPIKHYLHLRNIGIVNLNDTPQDLPDNLETILNSKEA